MSMKTVTNKASVGRWFSSGSPWVWLNAGAVAISVILVVGLLALIAVRGLGHFWPGSIIVTEYQIPGQEPRDIAGEIVESEEVPAARLKAAGLPIEDNEDEVVRDLLKVGNRDIYGSDFAWVVDRWLFKRKYPEDIMALERREWGNLYGYLQSIKEEGVVVATGAGAWDELQTRLNRALDIHKQIYAIEKHDIGSVNARLERLRLQQRSLELNNRLTPERLMDIESQRRVYQAEYKVMEERLAQLYTAFNRDSFVATTVEGREIEQSFSKIVRAYQPNAMSVWQKIGFYFSKLKEFVTEDPREANTEGGVFPAIFGTVMMVILMSIIVTPFGVVAAVYLREYASQGWLTRAIRIAVNNLAGVPSIVYGVFGLGFFIYFAGGQIDQLFFPEALPAPTFGTPGLLWASITLALLTLPVVIVATEEGLSRIPRSVREGSLALGATKAETLWRVVLPMASPAMMTGLILAVARAAGEVAPLMLVGVVKLAPSLPLDANYPFLHLDQKFMHLGFHIYDVGFQSPNVEAARPLVYATALLLVVVIAVLNLSAVAIRNQLREKYKSLEA
ncbi:phosphate ABC transporter permease PstA [Endozoicomonas gorgoniicola]|uniref:Phosphate transport system permease protein PstA n=1 Tax=Endozoicomonas gorgoniicola TaxID=1234144 RepID=A0ABT3MZW2_9GAMM|nr:phosphate ABC transporter permease PstA [Endozoicomonas gorgoniicola]MCW7554918.1 phosphate ABC transporter permease PstA [Endozoicomonas gorgoniicola]